jgi:hypothetical protein
MIVAPTATAPHAKHQPLQWKRGATSSSRDPGVRPASIGERVQVVRSVRVDHALRVTGGARRVVDRDDLLLVGRWALEPLGRARGEEVLIRVATLPGVIHPHDLDAAPLHER